MCRWFAYLSPSEPCLLEDVLIYPPHGLTKQVHERFLPHLIHHDPNDPDADKEIAARNVMYNLEGVGVAWYTSSASDFNPGSTGVRPALYKSTSPPTTDFNFEHICANTSSHTVFAHIRAATSHVQTSNCHPFVFGRHTFMHNGMITDFLAIKRQLSLKLDADTHAAILGSTDSELLAALYMTILTGGKGRESWNNSYSALEMSHALHEAIGTVIDLQLQVLGPRAVPNSLNLAATDGERMIACRFRNHKFQQPPSLYYSTTAGVTLNRKYPGQADGGENKSASKDAKDHGKHVIIASEPSTFKESEWRLIDKNGSILVEADGTFQAIDMPYDEHWNVEDPDGTKIDL